MRAVGIDIGGTKIAAGLVDEEGTILRRSRLATPADPRAIEDAVVDLVGDLASSDPEAVVGVAAAGFIDRDRAVVLHAPNIAWRAEPLRDRLQERMGRTVVVENDANAAGWAEYRFGAGAGRRDVTMLTLGTGVGGAMVLGGRLYRGGHGAAAELGHLRLYPDGLLCGCGQRGCLEQYASGRALHRIAGEIAEADPAGRGAAIAAARAEGALDAHRLSALIVAGDPGALEALRRVAVAVADGCASLSAVLDPELFIIGGGVAQLGDLLVQTVRDRYGDVMPAAGSRPVADIAIATLVNDAGVIGAADLARTEDDEAG